jgi:hypothetical protein
MPSLYQSESLPEPHAHMYPSKKCNVIYIKISRFQHLSQPVATVEMIIVERGRHNGALLK